MKHTLLLIICLAALGFFLTNFFMNSYREKDISQSSKLVRGMGWKNNKSLYAGGELGFRINNTENISFQFSTNSKADQGVEILVDDEKYIISSPNISKQKLTILVDKNKQHHITIRHFCTYFYEPCDITLNSINVNKASKIQPFKLHEKTISLLGDSISTIYGKNNYSHLLANKLDYELHNASILGSSLTEVKGIDNAVKRYEKDLMEYKSDIVVIFLGSNDAANNVSVEAFEKDYLEIINDIKKWNPKGKIFIPLLFTRKDISNENLNIYNNVISRVAKESNVYLIDTTNWLEENDFSDAIHPSINSQEKISEKFKEAIKKTLE